jgi:hypothetical protein
LSTTIEEFELPEVQLENIHYAELDESWNTMGFLRILLKGCGYPPLREARRQREKANQHISISKSKKSILRK